MNREDAIRLLKAAEPVGSTARGDAGPGSDVDVLIDLDMSRQPSLVDFCGTRLFIQDMLGWQTDLAIRGDLRPAYRSEVEAEAIPIF